MTREEVIELLKARGREARAANLPSLILVKGAKAAKADKEEEGVMLLDNNGCLSIVDEGYYWVCATVEACQNLLKEELK